MGYLTEIQQQLESEYQRRTPRSCALYESARKVMPGGDTRTNVFFLPYPTFFEYGKGCRIFDEDGHEYLDFLGNYTSLIHGHAHPHIVETVRRQIELGTCFASPLRSQVDLAAVLCNRVKSLERVRFCNSGTEATLNAIRLAKAFTGRNKIIKMEGGYHGSHDAAAISVAPTLDKAGPASSPHSIADLEGVFRGVIDDVIVAPFNDGKSTCNIIERHSADLAAVIIEPVLGAGGCVPASPEFLRAVRECTQTVGALLIFDEIITFRLAPGGAQEMYGISPDLTTLGKTIGGGFPVGAFGGREEIMDWFDPVRHKLFQGGTFNGNAVTMVAGLAALELMTANELARINALGERLRQGISRALAHAQLPGCVTGSGSLLQVQIGCEHVTDYRSAARSWKHTMPLLHMALLNRGIFTSTRNSMCISTPMTEAEVDQGISAFDNALQQLTPALAASV